MIIKTIFVIICTAISCYFVGEEIQKELHALEEEKYFNSLCIVDDIPKDDTFFQS
jgi:hypothetical protein